MSVIAELCRLGQNDQGSTLYMFKSFKVGKDTFDLKMDWIGDAEAGTMKGWLYS